MKTVGRGQIFTVTLLSVLSYSQPHHHRPVGEVGSVREGHDWDSEQADELALGIDEEGGGLAAGKEQPIRHPQPGLVVKLWKKANTFRLK